MDRRSTRGVALVLLLALLPGLAPDLFGAGCPHHAVSAGAGHSAGHSTAPVHAEGTFDAPPGHTGHGAGVGSHQTSARPADSNAGAPADAPDHDVPCRCLGSCPIGSAPSLPGASVAAAAPVPAPTTAVLVVASPGLPPRPSPPFLRPWVRGPPTSKA